MPDTDACESCTNCGSLEFDVRTNSGRIIGLECCRCKKAFGVSMGQLTLKEEKVTQNKEKDGK